MTISSNKIEDIMREYIRNIAPSRPEGSKPETGEPKPVSDNVTISEDGRKMMRERFQSDILNYLRSKY